ncbi:metal-sulfur cluster assembly factor [Rufibacter latericius]|uniref:Metal-sulfur cluster assembly factor n=1 Tax=Rufibacter latericius TaxID=2487040 RepID=A0A3M9MEZ8_9BACT|nr:metal-sulfur cluster assembly factor [Rufibacter latericius]RNI24136.1 metal-sulfur cluster assembly factor [Rufibacter latericius]
METKAPDTLERVLETLKYIIDPEIGINIVDLGLVYKVTAEEERIYIELTLTTKGCPMSGTITTATQQILKRMFPTHGIEVELVWWPMWSPELITDEGRRQLDKM